MPDTPSVSASGTAMRFRASTPGTFVLRDVGANFVACKQYLVVPADFSVVTLVTEDGARP